MGHYLTNFGGFGPKANAKEAAIYKRVAKELKVPVAVHECPMPKNSGNVAFVGDEDHSYDPSAYAGYWSLYYFGKHDIDLTDFWHTVDQRRGNRVVNTTNAQEPVTPNVPNNAALKRRLLTMILICVAITLLAAPAAITAVLSDEASFSTQELIAMLVFFGGVVGAVSRFQIYIKL